MPARTKVAPETAAPPDDLEDVPSVPGLDSLVAESPEDDLGDLVIPDPPTPVEVLEATADHARISSAFGDFVIRRATQSDDREMIRREFELLGKRNSWECGDYEVTIAGTLARLQTVVEESPEGIDLETIGALDTFDYLREVAVKARDWQNSFRLQPPSPRASATGSAPRR